METLLVLLLVVTTLILACVAFAAYEVRSIRSALARCVDASLKPARRGLAVSMRTIEPSRHLHLFPATGVGSFVIWEWSDGRWNLLRGMVPESVDPGPPPSQPGAFEKHHVRAWVSEA